MLYKVCHLCRRGKTDEMMRVGSCEYLIKQFVSNSHCDSVCFVSAVSTAFYLYVKNMAEKKSA
jgi:hypothetical protein